MKATGIIRHVDALGRIVIPIEIRRNRDISATDALEVYLEGNNIVYRKQVSNESCSVVRKADHLGRVTVPAEIRKKLDIENLDSLELFVDGDRIIYRKYQASESCALCGEVVPDLAEHGRSGKEVCALCASDFRK